MVTKRACRGILEIMYEELLNSIQTVKLNIGGRDIQTYKIGNGPRKVLMLPPFPASGIYFLWLFLEQDISDFTFYTVDLPGWVGDSDKYKRGEEFNLDDYSKIAQGFADYYDLSAYSLLGFSFGATLAIKLAADNLDKIQSLILVSPVVSGKTISITDPLKFLVKAAYKLRAYWLFKKVLELIFVYYHWYVKKHSQLTPEIYNKFIKLEKNMQAGILVKSASELFSADWSFNLNALKELSALIISSRDENYLFRKQADLVRTYLRHERTLYFRGWHQDFLLKPDLKLVGEILEFLREY